MSKNKSVEFPPLESAYEGEFGQIDPKIYGLAREVWLASGEKMALAMLNDAPQGLRLMMKAITKVGEAAQDSGRTIRSRKAYLRKTYKNLLLAQVEKEVSRGNLLKDASKSGDRDHERVEETLNHKILIHQTSERRCRHGPVPFSICIKWVIPSRRWFRNTDARPTSFAVNTVRRWRSWHESLMFS